MVKGSQTAAFLGAASLARRFFLVDSRPGAARRAPHTVPQLAEINLQLGNRSTQSVSMHAQFPRSAALVAFIFLQNGEDELFLELAHRFGIENIAFVHLSNERFELISHGISL